MTDSSALAAQIIPMYQRHARAWTALRGQVLYEKNWLDRLLRYLPAQAKILDLGCGSGRPIAAYLSLSERGLHPTVRVEVNFTDFNFVGFECNF